MYSPLFVTLLKRAGHFAKYVCSDCQCVRLSLCSPSSVHISALIIMKFIQHIRACYCRHSTNLVKISSWSSYFFELHVRDVKENIQFLQIF